MYIYIYIYIHIIIMCIYIYIYTLYIMYVCINQLIIHIYREASSGSPPGGRATAPCPRPRSAEGGQ